LTIAGFFHPLQKFRQYQGFDAKLPKIVIYRFGLHGYRSSTLEEVGREIGLTRESVRQIQMDALKRLRTMLESEGLSPEILLK